jgi:hypothetical protein
LKGANDMKVFLACVRDDGTRNDAFELFKEEKDAIFWVEKKLQDVGDTYKSICEVINLTIKKSYNSNFWHLVDEDNKGNLRRSFGYGYIYVKEIK